MSQSKIMDRMIEGEFKRQGIANFTNAGGENKVTWKSRVNQKFPGTYLTNQSGLPHQSHAISAMISKPGDFTPLQRKYGADPNSFNVEGHPYQLPTGPDNSFEGLEPTSPQKVGQHRPSELMKNTQVIRHPEGDPNFDDATVDEVMRHS
jgi:hypothetical protein